MLQERLLKQQGLARWLSLKLDGAAICKPHVIRTKPQRKLLLTHDKGHAMVDRSHICIRISRHHGEPISLPNAAYEDNILPWCTKLVLALDGIACLWRYNRLAPMRLIESRYRYHAPSLFHRVAPCRLGCALDACIENDPRLPRLLKTPCKLSRLERASPQAWRSYRSIE